MSSPHFFLSILSAEKLACGYPRVMRARNVGDNQFITYFLCEADKYRILDGSPSFVGKHAILQDLDPTLRPKELKFDRMPIWICILDIPFD